MPYSLVVQFQGDSLDLDELVALEDELIGALCGEAEVDGHDIGEGEANIFVVSDRPVETFARIQAVLEARGLLSAARVARRDLSESRYTVLWPESFGGEFRVA
jgi:hypothetical protein